MKIRHKLLLGFGSIILLFNIVGFFGLYANRLVVRTIEGDYQHLRDIVSSATAVSSYVKRAESHLMLYLALHEKSDLDSFHERLNQLSSHIQILDQKIKHLGARQLLDAIMLEYEKFVPYCDTMISLHDHVLAMQNRFDVSKYGSSLRKVNTSAAKIRNLSGDLAKLETDFLNRQEAISAANEISSYVKRAEGHLLLYLLLHNPADREKFFARNDSLQEKIQILERRLNVSRSKELLRELKAHAAALLPAGEELLLNYDQEVEAQGFFSPENHKEEFWQLHEVVTAIREDGENLTDLNTELEVERKKMISDAALENKRYLLTGIGFAVGLSILLALYLFRAIIFPLNQLKMAVTAVEHGDLSMVLEVKGRDELADLTRDFQVMTNTLEQTTISKNYLDSIVSSMAEGLLVIDRSGRVSIINRALCNLLDCAEEEVIGLSLRDFNPFGGSFREKWHYEGLLEAVTTGLEALLVAKDGRKIPVLLSTNPFSDAAGSFIGIVCVVQDISKIKDAEKAIVRAEVKRATVSAASLAAVGELTSSIVHEMRNPLASIQMNTEALRARLENDPVFAEMAEISLQQAERLAQMLADLLQYGKPITLHVQQVDARQFINEVLNFLGADAARKGIDINVEYGNPEIVLSVDKEMMVRAVCNIVENCIYWTPPHGRIAIQIQENTVADEVCIEVIDSGPGIPDEVMKTMFKPFVTMRKEGTGLGLANVRKIVDHHDGEVVAENIEGGARFVIRLPIGGVVV